MTTVARRLLCAALALSLLASHGVAAAVAYVCTMDGLMRASCCCGGQDEAAADEAPGGEAGWPADDFDAPYVADASDCCAVEAALHEIPPSLFVALPEIWPPRAALEVALEIVHPAPVTGTLLEREAFAAFGAAPIFVRLRTLLL